MRYPITTTIEASLFELSKKKGIKFSQALSRGIRVILNEDKTQQTLLEQEMAINKIANKLSEVSGRNLFLEKKMEELKNDGLHKKVN